MKEIILKIKSISKSKLLIILFSLLVFIALVIGGLEYKKYYDKKMEENKISADIRTPYNFYYSNYIPSISIKFSKAAVATDEVDKNANDAIKIDPKIRGEFKFTTTRDLEFKPQERWKPGTKYTITFDKKFGNFKWLLKDNYSFKTKDNVASINEFEFYENPKNITERKIIATIGFTYPVELDAVKDNVSLVSENGDGLFGGDKKLNFTLKISDDKMKLYVDSDPIKITEKEDYIVLKYVDGSKTLADRIRIPSSSDYFKFTSVNTTTVFNTDNQEEEQVVVLNFTRPVKVSDVLNNLEIFRSKTNRSCYYQNNKYTQEMLKNGEKIKYQNMSGSEKYSRSITLKIEEPKPDDYCLLTFLKDKLVSEDGFAMDDTNVRVNSFPKFTKDVKVMSDGAILNANSDKHLTFVSRGHDKLLVEINRLNEDAINHLITQTYGDFKSAYFENSYSFNEDNIAEKFKKTLAINSANPAKSSYSSIDLGKYLNGKRGIFILKTYGTNGDEEPKSYPNDRRMIIITDIGIMIKTNLDNSKNVFVSSIRAGKPISNAKVEVIGKNGLPIVSKRTNAEGYVLIPFLKDYKNEKEPVAYIVYDGGDVSFIPFSKADRNLNYSGFDVGGIYSSADETANANIKSFIFTDRGLYRPGENVEMGFIVKNEHLGNFANALPLLITIDNPQGNEVYRKLVDGNGLFDLSFATKSNAPTGLYTIYLQIFEKENNEYRFLTSRNFKVEEFQPDRMKIFVNFDNTKNLSWFNGENLKGKITLENLFGTPAQNRIIRSNITITPKKFNFSKYRGYRFTDLWKEDIYKIQQIVEELPEKETNNDGIVDFDLDLSKYKSGTYNLIFVAEGFEPDGGRSVVAAKNILISPLDYVVGYKTNSNLKYIKKNSQQQVNLIAVNQKLDKIDVANLKAKIQQINYESILTQETSGRLRYQKEKVYKDIATKNIQISKNGTDFILPTDVVGEIQITIVDSKENELAIINYNVVGESNAALSRERNAELNLVLNKSTYNSGDTIEMSITSPYTGYGLITIERDKVYAYKWFRANTTNSVQTITLPNNVEGNAYINVAFMRDLKSKEIFMSPLSYAVAPFKINESKFNVTINLNVPELVKPGDTINIDYRLNKKSDLIIYGVDEGILQVANYKLPDPLLEFMRKMALQVKTSQIFDLVLPTFEVIKEITGIGGGEGFNEITNAVNPFARKVEKPVAFWSGVLKDKTNGTYSYKVPEYFNGGIRVMAVAVANSSLGSTQQFLNSRGDLVIIPNFPVNISPNDKIDITVGVGNYIENSGKEAEIELTALTSSNLKITSNRTVKINVPENQEKTASFSIQALDSLGNGEITFTAKCISNSCKMEDSATIKSTTSLRPSTPYQVILESGKSKSQSFKKLIDFFKEYNSNQLLVSPSPLVLTRGLFDFLEEFPYGCTEQIVSKVFPLMIVKSKYPELITDANFEKLLANTITELTERQTSDGGFSAWPMGEDYGYFETNIFHTLYAMRFLTMAKLNGYYVPNTTFNRGIQWIQNFVQEDPDSLNDLRNKALGLYILTLNDILPTANLVSLEKLIDEQFKNLWENDVAGLYIASAYRLMQEEKMANKIINRFKFQDTIKYYSSYDSNDLRNVQYIHLTGLYFPNKFNKIKDKSAEMLLNIVQNNRYNTLLSSYSIMALSNYSNAVDDDSIKFILKDKNNKQLEPMVKNTPFTTLEIPNYNIKEVSFSSKEPVYYTLVQKGFPKNPSSKAISKNIEISKKLLNLDGKEIKSIEQGDELIIQLRIQNLTKDYMDNLAVVDLLPTGFEILNIIKKGTVFSTNIREDRFVGYLYLSNEMVEIEYRVKATTKGTIKVPSAYIEDLYNVENRGQSASGEFIIK